MSRLSRKVLGTLVLIAGLAMFATNASALYVSPTTAPNGRVDTDYSLHLTAVLQGDDKEPVVWTVVNPMPPGLSLSSTTGLSVYVTGSPTSSGSFNIEVTATEDNGAGGSTTFDVSIEVWPDVTIGTDSLPDGIVGQVPEYSALVSATGDVTYTWNADAGSELPPGLSFNQLTGLISGTPTTAGTYSIIFTAYDDDKPEDSDQKTLSLQINSPPFVPIVSYGQIAYVKDVERDADDGDITAAGDLYVKNLETDEERQITDYSGVGIILNPQLTSDGSEVLYTSDVSGTYCVYLVSTQATVSVSTDGQILSAGGVNLKYAALSPDYDGESGLLAYTYEKTDRTELWVYDFATETSTLIRSVSGLTIRDIVFVDDITIAYVGIPASMIQDIYTISADGGAAYKVTDNESPTPHYGRLQSSARNADLLTNMLIYSKSTKGAYAYGRWDVFALELGGDYNEYPITDTPELDEYAPSFYGSNVSEGVTLGQSIGQLFYEATILTDMDIWQANYDTGEPLDSNASKMQRTTGSDSGLPSWSPAYTYSGSTEAPVTREESRIVYAETSDSQIYRADYNGGWTGQVITTGASLKSDPSLAKLGGTIVFTDNMALDLPYEYKRVNHDGSGNVTFNVTAAGVNPYLGQATISNDSRWVAYVYQTGLNAYDILAKRSSDTAGAGTVIVTGLTTAPESLSFNPAVTKLAFAYYTAASDWDIFVKDIIVDNISGTIAPSGGTGIPTSITETQNDDTDPSFSNDGTKIIHVSDRWGGVDAIDAIYTMDVSGSTIEQVVENTTGLLSLSAPTYGPVTADVNGLTDMIAWIQGDTIYTGSLYRNIADNLGSSAGKNLVNGDPTGLSAIGKFSWGRRRVKGSILAQRSLPARAANGLAFDYDVVVDIDEAALPNMYIINEVLPSTFTVNSVTIDSGSMTWTTFANTPVTGQQTVKIEVMGTNAIDHVFRFNITPTAAGVNSVSGEVSWNYPPVTSVTLGNGMIEVGNPYMPVDLYNDVDELGPDGAIQDYDLLYAIDSWVNDAQLSGYGAQWPADTDNWDDIILAVINIWANDDADGKIDESLGTIKTVANGQGRPGEYLFIGDTDADGTVDLYSPGGAVGDGYLEMYWTEGEWDSLP